MRWGNGCVFVFPNETGWPFSWSNNPATLKAWAWRLNGYKSSPALSSTPSVQLVFGVCSSQYFFATSVRRLDINHPLQASLFLPRVSVELETDFGHVVFISNPGVWKPVSQLHFCRESWRLEARVCTETLTGRRFCTLRLTAAAVECDWVCFGDW